MTLNAAFRTFVLDDSAIAALISQRMFPVRLPEKAALPAITYQTISDVREPHLRGPSGLARARYQVDCYAQLPKDAAILGNLVRQRLDAYRGAWPIDEVSPPTTVQVAIFFESAMDLFDEDIHGGSGRHSSDYFLWHGTATGAV